MHPAPLAVMPPPAPPPPPVPPRAPPEKRPRRVEVIIKLGGSAITDKSKRHSLHDNRFAQSIDTITRLHRSGIGLIVVHGAGSFGHFEAREHAVSSGAASPIGVSVTHASVTSLNVRVVHALLAKGIPAVGVAPLLVPARTRVDFIAALLDRGHLPVLHGDACYAGDGRTAIISGDALVASLAAAFPFVNRVVFLSDVPGLLKKPPSQYSKTVTSSGNKQAMIAMQPNSGAPTSTNSAPGSLNPATSHFTNNSYNESGGPTTKATFPSVNRLKAGQAPSGTASPFADDIIRRIVVNEAGDLKFDDSSTGEKNKSTKDINFDMLPHDTTGGISAKIVAAAKCAAESAGRVTAFIAQVGSQAADIALMNRPDRAVTDMCTRVCFEPEGALPPLHVDDVPAEPPISIAAAEGNKKSGRSSSVTRTSLPKRGSGLTERARRRGWFT